MIAAIAWYGRFTSDPDRFRRWQDCNEYRGEAERARAQAALQLVKMEEAQQRAEGLAEEIAGLGQEVERLRISGAELREEIMRKDKADGDLLTLLIDS